MEILGEGLGSGILLGGGKLEILGEGLGFGMLLGGGKLDKIVFLSMSPSLPPENIYILCSYEINDGF